MASEVEDRMLEITTKEQNKEKNWKKKLRTVSETSETISNAPMFNLQRS